MAACVGPLPATQSGSGGSGCKLLCHAARNSALGQGMIEISEWGSVEPSPVLHAHPGQSWALCVAKLEASQPMGMQREQGWHQKSEASSSASKESSPATEFWGVFSGENVPLCGGPSPCQACAGPSG